MANPARSALVLKLLLEVAAQVAFFAVLLFVPAGTLDWWRAWVFVAVVLLLTLGVSFGLLHVNPDLLAERLKPPIQKGQPLADRIVLLALIAAFAGLIAFISLDVFRLHVLPKANVFVSSVGLGMFVAGWWAAYRAMRENAFATAVVRYQQERTQAVIDTGPYSIVRHPMYAGALLVMTGMPLWLESYAGALATIVPIGLLVLRIFAEESLLRRELSGYTEYMERVRYRLVPFVW